MLNVKQAYDIVKNQPKNLKLVSILDIQNEFGFLFSKNDTDKIIGGVYILVNKSNKNTSLLPTIPTNISKLQSGKKLPLTSIL